MPSRPIVGDKAVKSGLLSAWRKLTNQKPPARVVVAPPPPPLRIGLALGGGFARGIAHAGILDIFERHNIPIHFITGVSAGAIVASAYASGATADEIGRAGCAMRFGDVARWNLGRMGFVVSERMKRFLEKLLKRYTFEEMRIPLGVVATDLCAGERVNFHGTGDVVVPIRASCSYPGLFCPMEYHGRLLVDGAISVETPAELARHFGATRVISVHLPGQGPELIPTNMFQVVNRCFQIMQGRAEDNWRKYSDVIIAPSVRTVQWDGFGNGPDLIRAGQAAALEALPMIQAWIDADRAAAPSRAETRDLEPA
jgi:NTE family protein